VLLAMVCGALFFLLVLAAEGLHWATGGKTPSLLEGEPASQPSHSKKHAPAPWH
jgi:hypothetical protein